MNIKSLLLGSAAALAAVSGAQAADAIVAAEPEPMEYVRVCDAFGTGYFYIPGTETCLKIGGEVRVTVGFDNIDDDNAWDSAVRARLTFEAKNDSEIGTIGSYIRLQGTDAASDVDVNQAYITVGGFKVGLAATYWDDLGISGETDRFADATVYNMMSYTYTSDAFSAGLGVDDDSELTGTDDVTIQAFVNASLGSVSLGLYGIYQTALEDGAIYGVASADLGPGKFELAAMYTTYEVDSTYIDSLPGSGVDLEWSVAAAYTFKATDKLSITPSVAMMQDLVGTDAWGAGIYAEYALAEGLTASATVDYLDEDGQDGLWTGFVRLTRSF